MPDSTSRQTERIDEHLRVLADHRRRVIIAYFQRSSTDTATLQELVDVLEASETDDREDLSMRLHHAILPKLADAGVVAYEHGTRHVRYVGDPELEELVDAIHAQAATRTHLDD